MSVKKIIFLGLSIFGLLGIVVMLIQASIGGAFFYVAWVALFGGLFSKAEKDIPVDDSYTEYDYAADSSNSKRSQKGKKLSTFVDDYVILDLETTGFSPKDDKIIEIAAIRVRNNVIVDKYSVLINPGTHIPSKISKLTSINDSMVKDAPLINAALPGVLEFIGNDVVIAHNAHFDVNFLYDNTLAVLGKPFTNDFIDTLYLARKALPELSHHRLFDLAAHYNINQDNAHRALNDCETTFYVYNKLRG